MDVGAFREGGWRHPQYRGPVLTTMYIVFQKKTPTHIIGYKLRNSCLILVIFDIKIPHFI